MQVIMQAKLSFDLPRQVLRGRLCGEHVSMNVVIRRCIVTIRIKCQIASQRGRL